MRQGVLQPAAGGNQSQWTWPNNGTTLATFTAGSGDAVRESAGLVLVEGLGVGC